MGLEELATSWGHLGTNIGGRIQITAPQLRTNDPVPMGAHYDS